MGLFMLTAPGTARADALVVRATGPSAASYRPGTAIADSRQIVLRAGDSVTILDGRGTRTLKGPGSFSPVAASGGGASASRIAVLTGQASGRRPRIGAVREGCPATVVNTNIWMLDAAKTGPFCVADPTSVQLFRAAVGSPGTARITSGGKTETVTWEACKAAAPWPAAMPLEAGKSYTITVPGAAPATIAVKLLGGAMTGLEDTASKLITNGCSAQLDVLIDAVAVPGESAR